MSGVLAAGALAVVLVAGCVPAGEPVEFRERPPVSNCGQEDRLDRSAPRNLEARHCLLTAFKGSQHAEFVSHVLTVEGDPIHCYYRVWPTPDTPVEVFLDARRDRWSRHSQWSRSECRRLEPDAADVFLTADCEQAPSLGET